MIDGKIELSSGQAAVFAQKDIQFVNQQADFGIALTKQRRVIQFGDDRAGQAAENAFGRGGERIDFSAVKSYWISRRKLLAMRFKPVKPQSRSRTAKM